jgi:hypothetical protein
MGLQITCYKGLVPVRQSGYSLQVPIGPPVAINGASSATGDFTIPTGCNLIRLKGTGGLTWKSASIAGTEEYDGVEWRWVNPGDVVTIS